MKNPAYKLLLLVCLALALNSCNSNKTASHKPYAKIVLAPYPKDPKDTLKRSEVMFDWLNKNMGLKEKLALQQDSFKSTKILYDSKNPLFWNWFSNKDRDILNNLKSTSKEFFGENVPCYRGYSGVLNLNDNSSGLIARSLSEDQTHLTNDLMGGRNEYHCEKVDNNKKTIFSRFFSFAGSWGFSFYQESPQTSYSLDQAFFNLNLTKLKKTFAIAQKPLAMIPTDFLELTFPLLNKTLKNLKKIKFLNNKELKHKQDFAFSFCGNVDSLYKKNNDYVTSTQVQAQNITSAFKKAPKGMEIYHLKSPHCESVYFYSNKDDSYLEFALSRLYAKEIIFLSNSMLYDAGNF